MCWNYLEYDSALKKEKPSSSAFNHDRALCRLREARNLTMSEIVLHFRIPWFFGRRRPGTRCRCSAAGPLCELCVEDAKVSDAASYWQSGSGDGVAAVKVTSVFSLMLEVPWSREFVAFAPKQF